MSRATLSRVVLLLVAPWMLAVASVFGQPSSQGTGEDLSEYLPPGAGKALVAKQCTACHDLRGTVGLRQSKDAWDALVLDMVGRGALLTVEEADAISAYLSGAFSPTAPPLVDINTAPRDRLVKLPGVTPAIADRVVEHRTKKGPFSSRGEVQAVLGLDARDFERIKWYVRAGKTSAGL